MLVNGRRSSIVLPKPKDTIVYRPSNSLHVCLSIRPPVRLAFVVLEPWPKKEAGMEGEAEEQEEEEDASR